ncbi:acylphosphatase [Sulfurospirillum deleyianum]|uniref:acylphosphatase n=1 Tax=Sulfurospirillum deleyianum (strain ATCC 51133 / DSM 6946 / 5175) TaxID=525898 RepID=D1B1V2_SULD5|nr:acylphosphatase [Sulfurospirillum deleyianum]ACZ12072.1 acylphosphatase [Sulfurospirillum deleyianum DSM 6946]
MNTYRLIVTGRVQGVGYRRFVVEMAETLGYGGYVKNLPDGSVEVVLNATYEEDLEFFISKLYDGSMFSNVQDVTCRKVEHCYFDHFEKR